MRSQTQLDSTYAMYRTNLGHVYSKTNDGIYTAHICPALRNSANLMKHQSPGCHKSIVAPENLRQSERGNPCRVPPLRRDRHFSRAFQLPLRLFAKVTTLLVETTGNFREPLRGKPAGNKSQSNIDIKYSRGWRDRTGHRKSRRRMQTNSGMYQDILSPLNRAIPTEAGTRESKAVIVLRLGIEGACRKYKLYSD